MNLLLLPACLLTLLTNEVSTAKQQVPLSDSYLPVAMQVIAHLTDQMAFESKDEPTKPPPLNDWQKPASKPPKPTTKPPSSSQKPVNDWQKPTSKPITKPPYTWPPYTTKPTTPTNSWSSWTTPKPYVSTSDQNSAFKPPSTGYKPPASGLLPAFDYTPGYKPPFTVLAPSAFNYTSSGYKPPMSWFATQPSAAYKPPASGLPPALDYTSGYKPPIPGFAPPPSAAYKPPTSGVPATFEYASSGYKPPATGLSQPPPLTVWTMPTGSGWSMSYGLLVRDSTTPFHRPGFYAPLPPKPHERFRVLPKSGYLLPFDHHSQYTVIEPQETRSETLLGLQNEEQEVQPLVEPAQDTKLLPPHFDDGESEKIPRADLSEDNLQYLSQGVQEMIRMANDPDDERLVDVWEGVRGANNQEITPKGKLSASNLRLLLLYDLLSREAKRLRLSDYSGFSPSVLQSLSESSSGGARAQLSLALSRMVERKDCDHEYANNRAKEMVQELAKDDSKLSAEIRYLQPLIYQV